MILQITLSNNAGFCPGVRRADEGIRGLIGESTENRRIYTIGSLIHNRLYNEELASKGVNFYILISLGYFV